MLTLITAGITIILIVLSVLFFPGLHLKKLKLNIQTYWVIALIGALVLIITQEVKISELFQSLIAPTIGPIPILVLFISMTLISIFLDEVGFFKKVALIATVKSKNSQLKIFILLYLLTALLTIFTSNDIIILTFTPFICYFCRNTKINPIPYLVSEFICANTWSMMLLIGNPTNIYIAQSSNIAFFPYLVKMFIPTLITGIISFFILLMLFRKELKKPISMVYTKEVKLNKPLLIIGLIHLSICIILLSISSYINLKMWLITLISCISLFVWVLIYHLYKKEKPLVLFHTLRRAPYPLIPFLLSMFTICNALSKAGILNEIALLFSKYHNPYLYGYSSMIVCNLVNNIPMSVLYSEILKLSHATINDIYVVIASSNISAYFSPMGALAGIMWMGILKEQNVKFTFIDFIKYGMIIATLSLAITILIIQLL